MGMPRGLIKLTHAASTMAAWEDWEKLACRAVDLGLEDHEIDEPPPQAGHRKIDRHIAKLRKQIEQREWRIARDVKVADVAT